jgi:hypothetical protein
VRQAAGRAIIRSPPSGSARAARERWRTIPRRIHRALGHGGARTSQKLKPRRGDTRQPPKRNHAARQPLVSIGPARHARRKKEDHRRLIDRRLAEGQNVARVQVVDASAFSPVRSPAGSAPSVLRLPRTAAAATTAINVGVAE